MQSVAVSAIFIVISLALLVYLVMRGVQLLAASIIAGAILAFAVDGGWFTACSPQPLPPRRQLRTNLIVALHGRRTSSAPS